MPADTDYGVDLAAIDFTRPVSDIDGIRAINPHRFEMEMLSGIARIDKSQHLIVGWKDVRPDEFWVRGHMPGYPLLPGVLMCEAAAQLSCYYVVSQGIVEPDVLYGLGGLEKVRFLRPVRPGDRLILIGKGIRVHRRMTRFAVTGVVGDEKAYEAEVVGVPIGKWEDILRA